MTPLRVLARSAATVGVVFVVMAGPAAAGAADQSGFDGLEPGTRVYDRTGSSLDAEGAARVEAALDDLAAAGADPVVWVRALDATPEETLDQVEDLQQAWAAATGADQDTAIAFLVNRNPDDAGDARAGIYVGRTYQEGNVPTAEQEAIVAEALIPPLREGDVTAAVVAAVQRTASSVREGPAPDPGQQWAAGAARSWVPVAGPAAAVALAVAAVGLYRRRERADVPALPRTTTRPGDLPPAVGGALAAGGAQASALPATVLELATSGAVAVQPDDDRPGKAKAQIRLVDEARATHPLARQVWQQLQEHAEDGVLSADRVQRVLHQPSHVVGAVNHRLREEGWTSGTAARDRGVLFLLLVVSLLLAVAALILVGVSGVWWPGVLAPLALGAAFVASVVMSVRYSPMTALGQVRQAQWRAYRDGLAHALWDSDSETDLDAVLPDAIALGAGHHVAKAVRSAGERGQSLRAFTNPDGSAMPAVWMVPMWAAWNSSASASSGASGGVVSGTGAAGGGGAAGST